MTAQTATKRETRPEWTELTCGQQEETCAAVGTPEVWGRSEEGTSPTTGPTGGPGVASELPLLCLAYPAREHLPRLVGTPLIPGGARDRQRISLLPYKNRRQLGKGLSIQAHRFRSVYVRPELATGPQQVWESHTEGEGTGSPVFEAIIQDRRCSL
jgi:hypothetical protein